MSISVSRPAADAVIMKWPLPRATISGQHVPGHVDVGEHVHLERGVPVGVVAQARAAADAGVGAPDVDRPELGVDPVDRAP